MADEIIALKAHHFNGQPCFGIFMGLTRCAFETLLVFYLLLNPFSLGTEKTHGSQCAAALSAHLSVAV